MFDAVSAQIKFIQGHHEFGEIIRNRIINSELPFNGFRRSQQISYLDINFFFMLFANEVYFLCSDPSNGDTSLPFQC